MLESLKKIISRVASSNLTVVGILLAVKIIFQLILINSGLRWLTADDYSRTVISYDWLQSPHIYSGVWLSMHFWMSGMFIGLFNDMILGPMILSSLFSALTLLYLYLIFEKLFGKGIALVSCLVYVFFPFQVWLSISAMPEPVFFFYIACCFYHFLSWFEQFKLNRFSKSSNIQLIIAVIALNFSNLLRYEGWLFSFAFIFLVTLLSYYKSKNIKTVLKTSGIAALSILSALWWLYQNYVDYNDPFFFIKETTKIFKDLNTAGFGQRVVQYPFFIFYIAPLTTALGLWKIIQVMRNKQNGFEGNFSLVKIFLLFNLLQLLLLMLSGVFGSGGTNMVSRYIVMNTILLFPFAIWQLFDLRKYILISGVTVIILVNIIWSFYFQQAYRDDTYEVANLTKRLIQKNYFKPEDKIYFEMAEGYFDIYPIQVISNEPGRIISDTLPTVFPVNFPTKKMSKKKIEEERQKQTIIELRKFLDAKNVKLCIVRSELLIDKLRKLSYKSEQIGDYRIFYLAENVVSPKTDKDPERDAKDFIVEVGSNVMSYDKKIVLKDYRIDNTNLGLNPQTLSITWQLADLTILDSLSSKDDEFGRYIAKLELSSVNNDSTVYDVVANIFSERNTEEFFDTKEIRTILVLKPFAMLYYSRKFKLSPFESGIYDMRLSVMDVNQNRGMTIYKGDSIFVYKPDMEIDTSKSDYKVLQVKIKNMTEYYNKNPYTPLGRIIAMFPNANYNEIVKNSKELSQVIIRNGLFLPILQRYQGDQMLNIMFTNF